MATIQNMFSDDPAVQNLRNGGSQNGVLPSLRNSADLITRIRGDLERIDQLVASIGRNAKGVNFGGVGGGGSGNTTSNGMPVPSFGGQPQSHKPLISFQDIAVRTGQSAFSSMTGAVGATYQNDLLYNRMRTMLGGSGAFQRQLPIDLNGLYGAGIFGTADRNAGLGALYGAGVSPGVLMNPAYASGLAGISQATGMGLAQTAAIQASMLQNSGGLFMGRAAGIPMVDRNGNPMPMWQTLQGIYNATGTHNLSASLTNFGSLSQNLKGFLGIDQAQVGQLAPLIRAGAQAGTFDPNDPRFRAAAARLGLNDKATFDAMKRGSASDLLNAEAYGSTRAGMDKANLAADGLTRAFTDLYNVMQPVTGWFTQIAGAMGAGSLNPMGSGPSMMGGVLNQVPNDIIQGMILRSLTGSGGGGLAGKIPSMPLQIAEGGMLSRLGWKGGNFLKSGFGRGLGLGLLGMGLDFAGNELTAHGHKSLGTAANVLGGTAAMAGTGAMIGSMIGPEGTVIGGAIGGVAGLARGLWSAFGAAGDDKGVTDHTVGSAYSPGGNVLSFAQSLIGTPYSWGGGGVNGPSKGINQGANTVGFDCSSFVQYVFAHFGINLPRTTYQQVTYGQTVSPQNAAPGDLFFFGSTTAPYHVAIYLGGNKIIEAPHTGASVRITVCSPSQASIIKRVMKGGGYAVGASDVGGSSSGSLTPAAALTAITNARNAATVFTTDLGTPNVPGMFGLTGGGPAAPAVPGGSGSAAPAPANVTGAVALGKQMAAQMGWTGSEWNALYQLWQRESGWNANAVNKSSGAYGIPQALGHGNVFALGDARSQIEWGLNYIKGRYGDPQTAWSHEQKIGWYDKGAWKIDHDQLAVIHEGEMVVPKGPAEKIRHNAATGGRPQVQITVVAQGSTQTEAIRLAKMVKDLLEEDAVLADVGEH